MAAKLLTLLLGAFLLAQCCHCNETTPVDKSKDVSTTSEETDEWPSDVFIWSQMRSMPALLRMKFSIFHTCLPLFNYTLIQGANLFESVISDLSAQNTPSDSLQRKLSDFSQFVTVRDRFRENKRLDQTLDLHEVAAFFMHLVGKYNTTRLEQPSAEDLLIAESLQKHSQPFKTGFDRVYLELAPKIYKRAEKYFDSLSAEERHRDEKVIRKYEALKGAQDAETRRKCFVEFILSK